MRDGPTRTVQDPYVNTTRWPNAGQMPAQRLRRWANISPALGQRVVLAGRSLRMLCANIQSGILLWIVRIRKVLTGVLITNQLGN